MSTAANGNKKGGNSNSRNNGNGSSNMSDREKLSKIALVVDGAVFSIILSNEYLKAHFSFLCHACNSVLAYNFNSLSKSLLINLI